MHAAMPDLSDLGSIVEWLVGQWWFWVVVGIVLAFVVLVAVLPKAKIKPSPAYPTTGRETDELALGYIHMVNAFQHWNDPMGTTMSDKDKRDIVKKWGIGDRNSWLATIERLVAEGRGTAEWDAYLAVRRELGGTATGKEWLTAIVNAGGDKRVAKLFIASVEFIESKLRKVVGTATYPTDPRVTTFDGYAYGQAVAVATWGGALGYADETEVRAIVHRVNAVARPLFGSWGDFGASYNVGRIMKWGNGSIDIDTYDTLDEGVRDMAGAVDPKRNGPWAALAWDLSRA